MNSSSVSVRWDSAHGEFDFHRVTVANASVTNTLTVPKEEQVAVVTGLVDGCSYNVSAERVRGVTAGSAASLSVTTGRAPVNTPVIITCPDRILNQIFSTSDCFSSFPVLHECQPVCVACVS